ncbi:hypothetical protein ACLB2K_049401 [Fragaria x ananassa]
MSELFWDGNQNREITDKLFTITLDNAKNNDSAVVALVTRLNKRNGLLLDGEFFHIRCFAHVMNLVVRAGLEEAKFIIKRLRRSVKYVRSSPSRLQEFKKIAEEEDIVTKRYLSLDVKTRWNSSYLMIDAAMTFKTAFERLEDTDAFYVKHVDHVQDGDWSKLLALHVFLEEFYDITNRVSGSRYVTSITYMDELTQTKDLLDKHIKSEDGDLQAMAKLMNEKFEKYCKIQDVNQILLVALVLDPRNKLHYVEWILSKYFKDAELKAMVEKFKVFMSCLHKKYEAEYLSSVDVEAPTKVLVQDIAKNAKNASNRAGRREGFANLLKRKDHPEDMSDLDKYLQDDVENDDANFNILEWWKVKASTYRSIALMARDVLSIPITSVASECAFSSAKRVIDPFRSSLTPKTTEALVCTQDWIKGTSLPVIVEEKLEELEAIEKVVLQDMEALSIAA